MANGIGVSVTSDTKSFLQGVKNGVLQPLSDVDKTLADMGKAGDHAGTQLEGAFRQQQDATKRLKTDITSLNDTIKQGSRSSSQAVVENTHHQTQAVEAGFDEMKNSAKTNAISTAASFNGSLDSIGGGVQGLVSEFTAGFGPAGLVAGTVAAAGIGLAVTAIDNATSAVQVDQQAVAALAQQYLDAGSDGKRAFSDVAQAVKDMATNTDGSAIITLQDAFDTAGRAGADYKSVVDSIAESDPQQIQQALARVDALRKQDEGYKTLGQSSASFNTVATLGDAVQQAAVIKLHDALAKAKAQAVAAGRAQELAAEAGLSKFQQKADLIGLLQKGYEGAAADVNTYLDKESGVFDTAKYIKAMNERQAALNDYAKNLSEARLTPEAKSFLDSQGADAAAAMLAGYRKAAPKQKAELDRIWTTAGRQNAQTYGEAVGNDLASMDLEFPAPRVRAPSKADLARAVREAQAYLDAHPLRGGAVAYTVNGKPILG